MRIVFVGAVEFSQHCLGEILDAGGNVVGVLTLPTQKASAHSDYASVADLAKQHGIPVFELEKKINHAENVALIRSLQPDVIFIFGWSQLISPEIIATPPMGCIGTHPALLPRNRGRHPLIWALVEGLEESGLTFFYIDEGADSGDILWQKSFPITLTDDARSLYEKMKHLASEAICEFLPQLEQGIAPRTPQDHAEATYWRKRTEKDGEIQWPASTVTSYNLIRALTKPYVGAHTCLGEQKITIWRALLPETPFPPSAKNMEAGVVFGNSAESFNIRTGDGYLTITKYESAAHIAITDGMQLGECP